MGNGLGGGAKNHAFNKIEKQTKNKRGVHGQRVEGSCEDTSVTRACLTTVSAQDSEPLAARSNRPEALPSHQNPLLSGAQCNFTKTPHVLFQKQGWTQRDEAGGGKSLGQERPPLDHQLGIT